MLDLLRSCASGLAAKLLLAFLVMTFAVWGIGDVVRNRGSQTTVATVGGVEITQGELQAAIRKETDNIQRIMGDNYSPELLKNLRLEQQVVQKLVNRALLRLESERLGLVPSDGDVVRFIRSTPSLQDEHGNFDKVAFQAMLRASGQSEKHYIEQLRRDMAANLVISTLSAVPPLSEQAAQTLYRAREERRTADIYTLPPAMVSDVPVPGADQIEDYYRNHPREFTAPEYRALSYVHLRPEDIRDGADVSEEETLLAYKERIEEFKQPERRDIRQYVFSSAEQARKAQEMIVQGSSIREVMKHVPISNGNHISLGEITRGELIEEARDEVFSLTEGDYSNPVKTPFGWHVFHVLKVIPAHTRTLESVRAELVKDLRQHKLDESLYQIANRFEDALAGGSTLSEAASALGLKVSSLPPLSRQGKFSDGAAAQLPPIDNFLDLAFRLGEQTESPLTAVKNGGYVSIRIDSIVPERLKAIDEVRGQVVNAWQNEERQKRLGGLAQTIAKTLSGSAGERATVIGKYGLVAQPSGKLTRQTRTAEGNLLLPPSLVESIFVHKPGEATPAFLAKNGVYMLAIVADILPASAPANEKSRQILADIRKGLETDAQNELDEQYLRYLRGQYRVSIHEPAPKAATE